MIFTSDNGPHDESNHDLTRFKPSGPLRGINRSLTDGGVRVPMIAWRPGVVAAGSVNDQVGYFGDSMARFAEMAGEAVPEGCDSLNLVPTLIGKSAEQKRHELLYWEFPEGGFKQAALNDRRWKGIRIGSATAPVVVYDLKNYIGEQTDVAAENPEIAAKIEAHLTTAESADWEPEWKASQKRPK